MTLMLSAETFGEIADKATAEIVESGCARHISINVKKHQIAFKRNGDCDPPVVVVRTKTMFPYEEVADLVTLSLKDHADQRAHARQRFINFTSACKATSIIWVCPHP